MRCHFGRDTYVVPSNIVLDTGPDDLPTGREDLDVERPVCSYYQVTLAFVIFLCQALK